MGGRKKSVFWWVLGRVGVGVGVSVRARWCEVGVTVCVCMCVGVVECIGARQRAVSAQS